MKYNLFYNNCVIYFYNTSFKDIEMEIQVSSTSSFRILDCCFKKELLTNREVLDLDCCFIGTHLSKNSILKKDYNFNYQRISIYFQKNIEVLYNEDNINYYNLNNRIKKFKI